jgi:uncharacterized protein
MQVRSGLGGKSAAEVPIVLDAAVGQLGQGSCITNPCSWQQLLSRRLRLAMMVSSSFGSRRANPARGMRWKAREAEAPPPDAAAAEGKTLGRQNPLANRYWHNYCVLMLRCDWDPKKSAANKRKHGVSFEEAQTVFYDDRAVEYADPEHSDSEERFLLLGRSLALRVLVVCHCYRESEELVRIISARKATPKERGAYASRGRQ